MRIECGVNTTLVLLLLTLQLLRFWLEHAPMTKKIHLCQAASPPFLSKPCNLRTQVGPHIHGGVHREREPLAFQVQKAVRTAKSPKVHPEPAEEINRGMKLSPCMNGYRLYRLCAGWHSCLRLMGGRDLPQR